MKKLLFSLILGLIYCTIASAQNHLIDVITLKNGSIVKGIIIEQIPNKSVKLEARDGSVFVYTMAEIEKLSKEASSNSAYKKKSFNRSNPVSDGRKGYIGLGFGVASVGIDNSGSKSGFTLNLVDAGYLFSENIGIAFKWGSYGRSIDLNDFNERAQGSMFAGVGFLMTGLLASLPASESLRLEAKPLIGFGNGIVSGGTNGNQQVGISTGLGLALGLDLQVRLHLSEKIDLTGFLGHTRFSDTSATYLGVGLSLRLR